MSTEKYVLGGEDGHTSISESDFAKWGEWFEAGDRIVKKTKIGKLDVSTVFLGIDHNFFRTGPPLLFETMVFVGDYDSVDDIQERCATWDEAEKQHERIVEEVKNLRIPYLLTASGGRLLKT